MPSSEMVWIWSCRMVNQVAPLPSRNRSMRTGSISGTSAASLTTPILRPLRSKTLRPTSSVRNRSCWSAIARDPNYPSPYMDVCPDFYYDPTRRLSARIFCTKDLSSLGHDSVIARHPVGQNIVDSGALDQPLAASAQLERAALPQKIGRDSQRD